MHRAHVGWGAEAPSLLHELLARRLHRAAHRVAPLGAVQEGIVRHERIMPDGRKRTSVRFSIIDSEWPQVKANLQAKLHR